MHIHVIHENPDWLQPLAQALDAAKLPWRDWFSIAAPSILRSRRPKACSSAG